MKPFDLEKALAGYRLITRIGFNVLSFARLRSDTNDYPFVFETLTGLQDCNKKGERCKGKESRDDLFMFSELYKGWIAIKKVNSTDNKDLVKASNVYKDREKLEKEYSPDLYNICEVEFFEEI